MSCYTVHGFSHAMLDRESRCMRPCSPVSLRCHVDHHLANWPEAIAQLWPAGQASMTSRCYFFCGKVCFLGAVWQLKMVIGCPAAGRHREEVPGVAGEQQDCAGNGGRGCWGIPADAIPVHVALPAVWAGACLILGAVTRSSPCSSSVCGSHLR